MAGRQFGRQWLGVKSQSTAGWRDGAPRTSNQFYCRRLRLEPLENRLLLAADFGDAPNPYPTLLASNGAQHEVAGPRLGALVDAEINGQVSATATGDDTTGSDDDDGVTFGVLQIGQLNATVTVNIQNAPQGAKLDAWIDFNGDGSWNTAEDHIASSVNVVEGNNIVPFAVPNGISGNMKFARFRISTLGELSPAGSAADGEVEDYQVTISPPSASNAHFGYPTQLSATRADDLQTVDVDRDGDLDLVSASIKADQKVVWNENNGNQSFTAHLVDSGGDYAYSVAAADMDGDGDIDLLSAANDDTIAWHENDGQQNFTTHAILPANLFGRFVKPADIDGDGDLDIVAVLRDRTSWLENVGGSFIEHLITTANAGERASLDVADLDADGDLDLVTAYGINGEIAWYENNFGAFAFHAVAAQTGYTGYSDVRAADLDGDGRMDIFAASRNGAMAVYKNLGGGVFTTRTLATALSTIGAIDVADMNGDGRLDLVTGPGQWKKNLGNLQFGSATFAPPGPPAFYSNVIAADLDRDGDIDTISDTEANETIRWYENANNGIDFTGPYPYLNAESSGVTLSFQVARHGDDTAPLTVLMSLSGTASLGIDYTVSGATLVGGGLISLTIPSNNYLKSFQIIPLNDSQFELDETIVVTLVKQPGYVGQYSLNPWMGATILDDEPADFGDAPAPYPTLEAQSGPRHGPTGPQLGSTRDTEMNGQQSVDAGGDDEPGDPTGGIAFGDVRVGQQNASVTVNVQNAPAGARLDAWLDYNHDGHWEENGEHVLVSALVQNGPNLLTFDVQSNAFSGSTYARFRLSTTGGLGIVGESLDGEVEDVMVTLQPPAASSGKFAFGGKFAAWSVSRIEAADLDNDGDLDLVWTSLDYSMRGIYWSENVAGDFETKPPMLIDASAHLFSIGDLDNDGDIDLLTSGSNPSRTSMWCRNDGSGNFVILPIVPVGAPYYVAYSTQLVDLDQDGDLDVLGSPSAGFAYLANQGEGQFVLQTPTNYGATAVGAPVDLDRDGDLDFVPLGTNTWIENTGGNVFAKRFLPSTSGDTITARLVVDLDHDGYADVVGTSSSQSRLAWLHNNGNRTFTQHYTNYYVDLQLSTSGAGALTAGDVDGDGFVDIVNARDSEIVEERGVYWYKNNGAGNFTQRFFVTDAARYLLQAAYVADIDNDGDLDFLGTTSRFGDHFAATWYRNVSTGVTIAVSPQISAESGGAGLTYTFHRVDSTAKVLTVNFDVSGSSTYGSDYNVEGAASFGSTLGTVVFPIGVNTVQVNVVPVDDIVPESSETVVLSLAAGDDYVPEGNVTAIGTIVDNEPGDFGDAPGPYPTTVHVNGARHIGTGPTLGLLRDEELDGQPSAGADGDDATSSNDEDGAQFGVVRVGQTDTSVIIHVEGAPAGAHLDAWIDFNGDGNWGGPSEKIAQSVFVQDGDNAITFDVPSNSVSGTTYGRFRLSSSGGLSPYGVASDGEVEDYALSIDAPRQTSAAFAAKQPVVVGEYADSVAAADFDDDGDIDFAGIADGNNQLAWYENNGQGGFTRHVVDATEDGSALTAVDLDGDGDYDIVAVVSDYDIRKYMNDGHGNFVASAIDYLGASGPAFITGADLDGDADMDLLVGAGKGGGNLIEWLENTGAGGFVEHLIADKTGNIGSIDVADLDGDGDLDLVSTSSWWDDGVYWYENDGHAQFGYHELLTTSNPKVARMADIDGDGDVDILGGGSGLWAFVNDGAGNFQQSTIANVIANGITLGDLDGDGDIDMIANLGSGSSRTLRRYLNDGVGVFTSQTIESGNWVGYRDGVTADFDGDGALDFVSSGTLYWYRNIAPLTGDFNQDQTVDNADYILWRKTQGTSVGKFSGADANGDGLVGTEDFNVWRAHFGQSSTSMAAASGSTTTADMGEDNRFESPTGESSQPGEAYIEGPKPVMVGNGAETKPLDNQSEVETIYRDVTTAASATDAMIPPLADSSIRIAAIQQAQMWRNFWYCPSGPSFEDSIDALLGSAVRDIEGASRSMSMTTENTSTQFSRELSKDSADIALTATDEDGFGGGPFGRPTRRWSVLETLSDHAISSALADWRNVNSRDKW